MRLSKFTDYALRVCLYLAAHEGRLVSISEISRAHEVSQSNLMKVVNQLVDHGVLQSTRGRSGGVMLAHCASDILVGQVARKMEGDAALVDCDSCILRGSCGLVRALREAKDAFYANLDRVTLRDAVGAHPRTLDILLGAGAAHAP
ncbi:Rrf2 family transcriptional regulator [Citreicella sp. C3M06]|uniref:RrF2 family transcriptional regulator n=1 Tax=Citreicella sp. C3M06 TaxID=2841564 RepID=UPI001C08A5D1|nr:Rrf2 family transcriptional regulator [Citreicella sp. C3M06]MBU2963784.1 Rrf2 family transcriptional regulator [Citreicella sp. C3M06]